MNFVVATTTAITARPKKLEALCLGCLAPPHQGSKSHFEKGIAVCSVFKTGPRPRAPSQERGGVRGGVGLGGLGGGPGGGGLGDRLAPKGPLEGGRLASALGLGLGRGGPGLGYGPSLEGTHPVGVPTQPGVDLVAAPHQQRGAWVVLGRKRWPSRPGSGLEACSL